MKKRHILLLDDSNRKDALIKTEREFSTKITSSSELSSKVRAHNVYESGNGLHLKNLGIVIIEDDDTEKIEQFCSSHNSPVQYYEESKKIFRPVQGLDIIDQLKDTVSELNNKINDLEEYLKSKHQKSTSQRLTWGLEQLEIDKTNLNGEGIDVCILDTGFYLAHPDFKDREIKGKSFVPNESWEEDRNGHGTHCAGVAVGGVSQENGLRYGIASAARVVIGKVLDDHGNGATDWLVDALDNCIEKKYNVVSLSLGAPVGIGHKPSQLFERLGQVALKNNCLLIAAAGNESKRPSLPKPVNAPANCESFMAVAALDRSLTVANFSNAGININNGGRIDLSAPGIDIYSAYSPNAAGGKLYATLEGTSMATPHVAGLAATYFQAFPNKTAVEIWMKLEKNAKQLNKQLIRDVGSGLPQAIM